MKLIEGYLWTVTFEARHADSGRIVGLVEKQLALLYSDAEGPMTAAREIRDGSLILDRIVSITRGSKVLIPQPEKP